MASLIITLINYAGGCKPLSFYINQSSDTVGCKHLSHLLYVNKKLQRYENISHPYLKLTMLFVLSNTE